MVEEEEEKEQFSPVSVLDPPFEDDDDCNEEGSYDLECSYAIVQSTYGAFNFVCFLFPAFNFVCFLFRLCRHFQLKCYLAHMNRQFLFSYSVGSRVQQC